MKATTLRLESSVRRPIFTTSNSPRATSSYALVRPIPTLAQNSSIDTVSFSIMLSGGCDNRARRDLQGAKEAPFAPTNLAIYGWIHVKSVRKGHLQWLNWA